jgi:hypothetical protein
MDFCFVNRLCSEVQRCVLRVGGEEAAFNSVNTALSQQKEVAMMAHLTDGSSSQMCLSFRSAAGNLDEVNPPPPNQK